MKTIIVTVAMVLISAASFCQDRTVRIKCTDSDTVWNYFKHAHGVKDSEYEIWFNEGKNMMAFYFRNHDDDFWFVIDGTPPEIMTLLRMKSRLKR